MTDAPERPRPQYGEYATPEEQRARIQQPDVTWALETGQAPAETGAPALPPGEAAAPGPATSAPRRRLWDRVITVGLLVYAVLSVATSIPALIDWNGYVAMVFQVMGVSDAPTPTIDGRPWGIAASLVLGVGLLLTAAVSWILMRRGRLAFWVPIAGAVVFNLVSGALLLVPLMSDPALLGALVPQ